MARSTLATTELRGFAQPGCESAEAALDEGRERVAFRRGEGAGETLVIERHGKPIGFFVPVDAKDRRHGRAALGRLGQAVESVLVETGLDEEQAVRELTEKRRR